MGSSLFSILISVRKMFTSVNQFCLTNNKTFQSKKKKKMERAVSKNKIKLKLMIKETNKKVGGKGTKKREDGS